MPSINAPNTRLQTKTSRYSPWRVPSYPFKKVLSKIKDTHEAEVERLKMHGDATDKPSPAAPPHPEAQTSNGVVKYKAFSVLNPANVFHDEMTLIKLSGLDPTQNPANFICYQPARIALHEVITTATIRLQYDTEDELQSIIKTVHERLIPKLDDVIERNLKLRKTLVALAQEIISTYPSQSEKQGHFLKLVFTRVKALYENYAQSDTLQAAFKDEREYHHYLALHIADITYTKLTQTAIRPYISDIIFEFIKHNIYQAMPLQHPKDRITFTVAGGTASGKTSSIEQMKHTAKEVYGIPWRQIAKLNTDMYKSILLEPDTVDPTLFSQFSSPEASYVHRLVQKTFEHAILIGKAPHMLIDQVFVNADKLDLSIFYAGRVEGMVVSTDVRTAVHRSFQRGVETGRYEATQTILRTHRSVALELPRVLNEYTHAAVTYRIMDNNGPKGSRPIEVALINLKTKCIEIYSIEKMLGFISKCDINLSADSDDTVLPTSDLDVSNPLEVRKRLNQYFAPLLGKCKINIKDEMAKTIVDLSLMVTPQQKYRL